MASKRYVRGSAREHVFDNGSSLINFTLNVDDLAKEVDEKGWVRLVMTHRMNEDEYGNTHTMYFNDFKPEKQEVKEVNQAEPKNDLPF